MVTPKITGKAHEKTPPNICPSTRVLSPYIKPITYELEYVLEYVLLLVGH
jgi:hypothetical protein